MTIRKPLAWLAGIVYAAGFAVTLGVQVVGVMLQGNEGVVDWPQVIGYSLAWPVLWVVLLIAARLYTE